ncbi:hypothetical protein OZX56_04295 [Lactobacillus sp. ESL0684]|uniref:hypothetical protein n=1 Tax=Lactobacillus sp. ESL0684 TaxID=2983213 RepID=UPI0023F6DF5E|nr:hypothetical protein [Lactobacillus sp. ESL0684]WEV44456.1 hypothetical protein OZX56_04295 [Lactobacillus sp. ESL0684]
MFFKLFRQFLRKKSRSAYGILVVELISAIVLAMTGFFSKHTTVSQNPNIIHHFLPLTLVSYLELILLFDAIYLLVNTWQNEKYSFTQSLRLVPLNDTNIYLCNILSSFTSFIYFVILQGVTSLGLFGICYGFDSKFKFQVSQQWAHLRVTGALRVNSADLTAIAGFVILLILTLASFYLITSFINFLSHAITAFLPRNSYRLVLNVTRLVILVGVIWLLSNIFNAFSSVFLLQVNKMTTITFWQEDLRMAIWDLAIVLLNLLLINRFVEAKQNN